MLEPVSEDRDETVGIAGVVECETELADRIRAVHDLEPPPFLGLGLLYEVDEGVDMEAEVGIVPVASSGVSTFG